MTKSNAREKATAKYIVRRHGKVIKRPKWVDAENLPFQTAEDARDWGDEITVCAGKFTVESVDGSYVEHRKWVRTGEGVYQANSKVDNANDQ